MRIVHIITRLIVGGAQENTVLSCRGLAERGHTVTLLTGPETGPEGEMFIAAEKYGIRVEVISSLRRNISPLRDLASVAELVAAMRRLRPDVVHTHSSKAGIVARLAGRVAGVRCVVHTIHGLPFFSYQGWLANRAYVLAERLAARWADRLVVVADDMTRQACAARVAPRQKFVTIRSGLETESFRPCVSRGEQLRRALGIPCDAFVVGKVARLVPLKGHEYLLGALKEVMGRHANVWCLLVGDGSLRSDIERELQRSKLADRVRLTGLIEPGRVPETLWAMDMLVHTSLHEGLPRAVVQGLLAGLPVAAFDLDGASEVIERDRTGYLIKPCSVPELVEAIEGVLTGSGPVKRPSADVRAELEERFSWERMVDSLEELYYSLLEERTGAGGRR